MTVAKHQAAIALCLIALTGSGCATKYQKVDAQLLEQSRGKTFKLGIVKAAGSPMGGFWQASGIESKRKALDSIRLNEICSVLSSKYAITIDANVDRTSNVVREAIGGGLNPGRTDPGASYSVTLQAPIDNAYFGNLKYENSSTLGIAFGSSSQIINGSDFPDVVDVVYSLDYGALGFKTSFHYDVSVRSSGQDIVTMHGIIASIPTPMNTVLVIKKQFGRHT